MLGGEESKEQTSGAELEIGSHVAVRLCNDFETGAVVRIGDGAMGSTAFEVFGNGCEELANGSEDSKGLVAGLGGARCIGRGELAKGSSSSSGSTVFLAGLVGPGTGGLRMGDW